MLRLSGQILGKPVLSLRTGSPVGSAVAPIFNPTKLTIEGFYVRDSVDKAELILLCQDIREMSRQGFIVNDHDVLSPAEDLVRLKHLIEINYELLNKRIETVSKQKVGKVSDYAVETNSMAVQKIYAARPFWKNLAGGSLSIDRSQIVEITSQRIIINELLQAKRAVAPVSATVGT